jgi:NAD(P)-dependent dehydrogenase (short-subunit alcohol dehydrogenase family)
MKTEYENKRIALITGANRGIGFEIARQLAHRGVLVIVGSREEEKGINASEWIAREEGADVHFCLLDVADAVSIQAAVSRIVDRFGRLDILVNNAGIMIDADTEILELSPSVIQNTLETNAFGPLLLSQACVPHMKKRKYGRIVNLSSTLGSLTDISDPRSSYVQVGSPAYRMSKTLLNAVTVLIARELRGSNILVNSVCPGWVRTDMGGPQAPLSPGEAAETPVWLATLPDDGPTGGFFRDLHSVPW